MVDTGGVIFPIALDRLFARIGLAWTLRVICLFNAVGCLLAWLSVSSCRTAKEATRSIFDHTTFKDQKYLLLVAGSCLVSFGKPSCSTYPAYLPAANR